MGTNLPRQLTGTAVAVPGDSDSHVKAYEIAQLRLDNAAAKLGVFIGPRTFQEVVHARGRHGGHDIIIVTAPVLDTGTDDKIGTARHFDERDQP